MLTLALAAGSAAAVEPALPSPASAPAALRAVTGQLSHYAELLHGGRTASGEAYDHDALTMAHPTLPLGTRVLVTNLRNGMSVVLRVNDRMPAALAQARGRVGDVSGRAARLLGFGQRGVVAARVEPLQPR